MEEKHTNQQDTEIPPSFQEGKSTVRKNDQAQEPLMNKEFFVRNSEDVLKMAEEAFAAMQKAESDRKPTESDFLWEDDADSLDGSLKAKSEGAYIDIANKIVDSATDQLHEQNMSKNSLKKVFTVFFVVLLSVQYLSLAALLFIRAFQEKSLLSDTVIITYITSVFLETLGAVVIMIRYAFASDQETKVLTILNSIIERFKKFSS